MLNWNEVLRFVKGRLALPSTFIEKSDDQIKEWVIEETIPAFSKFYPDIEFTGVDVNNPNYKHVKQNHYYFFDDEQLDIYAIRECYFPGGDLMALGHPIMGPTSFEGMKDWALQVFKSKFVRPFSDMYYTYQFYHPNVVRALGLSVGQFVVEYEREQPHDLRRIPNVVKQDFKRLALADVQIMIGTLRSHYGGGQLSSPFGEIPLQGDTLKSEGMDMRREILEKLEEQELAQIVIDIS